MNNIVAQQFKEVQQRVTECAAGKKRVMLLPVSKTFPAADIAALYAIGCRSFGENRVQELEQKAAALPSDIEWHLIGQLQNNKVRKAVRTAAVIHSVDSAELVRRIDRIAAEEKRHPKIMLEINISGEASKSGMPPENAPEAAAAALAAHNIELCGLMTIPPATADTAELRRIFCTLAAMRDDLEQKFNCKLPELSMGMSGDFPLAIECGATIIRVGTAIFGHR